MEAGDRFTRLTALRVSDRRDKRTGGRYWWFRCDCGVEKEIRKSNVKYGSVISCGCSRLQNRNTGKGLYFTNPTHKVCALCKENKTIDNFSVKRKRPKVPGGASSPYFNPRCYSCCSREQSRRHATEEVREQRRAYKEKHREDVWHHITGRIATWRKETPGSDLTSEYLKELFDQQEGLCYYLGVPLLIGTRIKAKPNSISLDKLDPARGYVKGNVVWCSFRVNTSKGNLSEEEFYSFLREILDRQATRLAPPQNDRPELSLR